MEELLNELFEDLKIELENEEDYSEALLKNKIRNAVREVKSLRKYPDSYTDEMVLSDLNELYSKIRGRAMYDYNQIGAESQSAHTENGITRSWRSKDRAYPIIALSNVI